MVSKKKLDYAKKYRLENPDYYKNYRQKNRDKLKQYFKKISQSEDRKFYMKEWRKKNVEKLKIQKKQSNIRNKDKIRARLKARYLKNYKPIIINCMNCNNKFQKKTTEKVCHNCREVVKKKQRLIYYHTTGYKKFEKKWDNDNFLHRLIGTSTQSYRKSQNNNWDKSFAMFHSTYKTTNDRVNIKPKVRLSFDERFNNLYNYVSKRLLKRSGKKYSTDKYSVIQEMYYSKIIAVSHRVNNPDSLWEKRIKKIGSSRYVQQ